MDNKAKAHGFDHDGWCYDFDNLEDLVARVTRENGMHPSLPAGAIKKAAQCLGMKPKAVKEALIAGGMPVPLKTEEMIGRVSHMGDTYLEFVGRRRDSKGCEGRCYKVRRADGRVEHDFVHNVDQNTRWYYLAGTEKAREAIKEAKASFKAWRLKEKRDAITRKKVVKALKGLEKEIGLETHYHGMVVLENIRSTRTKLYKEVQRRLEGLCVLDKTSKFGGTWANFVR